jgi:hypothetical protein
MTVEELFVLDKQSQGSIYAVTGVGYKPNGVIVSPE